ncbi:hypothetical protein OXX69_004188 [Metschnikowia pulcherrima]
MADINVEDTLSALTLKEKIGLISGIDFWHTSAVERLGVPSVRVSDGPNGIRGTKFCNGVPAACFPCGTGMAATFNKDLLYKAGALMADEAKAKSASCILGPTTNIQRGPLGGRGFESFSEDPFLAGMVSVAVVNGMQENDVASAIKHYVCNDLEHERSASDTIVTERALREIYLEPFRLAVKYANPASFMTAYNKVNGEHVSQSKKFLDDILRKEWGWDGLVMSDWFGAYTIKDSIKNGLDLEMPGPSFLRTAASVSHMISSREINIQDLDDRVRNVLKFVKWCARAKVAENGPEEQNNTAETRATLNQVATESIVLLKNENGLLPLKRDETIAVIGPNAKYAAYCGGGSASLPTYYATTPFDSISEKLGKEPAYAVGCYGHKSLPGISTSPLSRNPVTGEPGINVKFYNQAPDSDTRTQFDEFQYQNSPLLLFDYKHPKIVDGLYYADITTEITPDETCEYDFSLTVCGTAQLFVDGELLIDNKTHQTSGNSFFGAGTIEVIQSKALKAGQTYKVSVQFGCAKTATIKNDSVLTFGGAISVGFCKVIDVKKEIQKAADLASQVDKVVLAIGLNLEWESEGFDRPDMSLPPHTDELVAAVLKANPNTVVVNQSGTPVEMPWLQDAKALVHAWYGGSESGNAIANVLFGDENPSGKLSLSWPLRNVDNPAYLNFKTVKGRVLYGEDIYVGYRYYEKLQRQVAFPFGYGKSYTTFRISDLDVEIDEDNDKLIASVVVENTGNIAGSETVQLYIAPQDSPTDRPIKELKGFEKTCLEAGVKKTVKFSLSLKDSASFFDEYLDKWHLEAGAYEVQVGSSSDDIEARTSFNVKKEKVWTGL